jgi:hypothetical protein
MSSNNVGHIFPKTITTQQHFQFYSLLFTDNSVVGRLASLTALTSPLRKQ